MDKVLKRANFRITEVKAVREEGGLIKEIEGYASVFGNVDFYGEIMDKGCFTQTIADKIPMKMIKLVSDHETNDVECLLGTVDMAVEDDFGLKFHALVSSAPSAQDTCIKASEGHLDQISVGFYPEEWAMVDDTLHHTKVELWDISLVPYAANPLAKVTNVKAAKVLERLSAMTDEQLERVTKALDNVEKLENKQGEVITELANENEVVEFLSALENLKEV